MAFFVKASYRTHDGCRFDYDHYDRVHIPLGARQMEIGGLTFDRREIERHVVDLFTDAEIFKLTIVYVSADPGFVSKFADFMNTPLVQPLIDDAAIYTDCSVEWSSGSVD